MQTDGTLLNPNHATMLLLWNTQLICLAPLNLYGLALLPLPSHIRFHPKIQSQHPLVAPEDVCIWTVLDTSPTHSIRHDALSIPASIVFMVASAFPPLILQEPDIIGSSTRTLLNYVYLT
jgi:hypothetical protein